MNRDAMTLEVRAIIVRLKGTGLVVKPPESESGH